LILIEFFFTGHSTSLLAGTPIERVYFCFLGVGDKLLVVIHDYWTFFKGLPPIVMH
jgi:hypothetical protein